MNGAHNYHQNIKMYILRCTTIGGGGGGGGGGWGGWGDGGDGGDGGGMWT